MSGAGEIEREKLAIERLKAALDTIAADADWYWRWGDGEGGFVLDELAKRIRAAGHPWPYDRRYPVDKPKKDKIPRALSKRVLERDAYRCVTCGSHLDLCCDHIIPESKGGPTTFENLQAMCRSCNSKKGAREL